MHDSILSLGVKLKALLQRKRIRHLTKDAWRRRHRKVFRLHPQYKRPCPKAVEREHLRLWRQLRPDVSLHTLRICFNVSGNADPAIVPEEVFASEIERALNRHDECQFLANKSFYNRWFPGDLFPRAFLHNIEGEFYGADYEPLDPSELPRALDEIPYPVVIKPSMGLSGGKDVHFPKDRSDLARLMAGRRNFVVQQQLSQDEFFRRFDGAGLNTLRVCTYKSVLDNELHILNAALRMGRGGSLDNLKQGGIVCFVHEDGSLNDYALDIYGAKFLEHPDTGVRFCRDEVIPCFDSLKQLIRSVARDIYLARLVSFDVCLDDSGQWRVIEVNLRSQTIRFAQYAGHPFFGKFTREVIEYCKEHPRW